VACATDCRAPTTRTQARAAAMACPNSREDAFKNVGKKYWSQNYYNILQDVDGKIT
jgi:hypothetical protein